MGKTRSINRRTFIPAGPLPHRDAITLFAWKWADFVRSGVLPAARRRRYFRSPIKIQHP